MAEVWVGLYLWGCAWALGSATAAILRGETGVLGLIMPRPPVWALIVEVLVAGIFSWATVGFCQVQNAYRSAGQASMSCGANRDQG